LEVDGNNILAFVESVRTALAVFEKPTRNYRPNNIPGKGVHFMEKDFLWHGKPPNRKKPKKALAKLKTYQGRSIKSIMKMKGDAVRRKGSRQRADQ